MNDLRARVENTLARYVQDYDMNEIAGCLRSVALGTVVAESAAEVDGLPAGSCTTCPRNWA